MTPSQAEAVLAEIAAHAVAGCAGREAAHDELHLRRVLANARLIAAAEQADGAELDTFVLEAACWLHDLVQLPKGAGPAGESARRSALAARALLVQHDVPEDVVERVAHAVEAHSFSGGLQAGTLEARILQDADRLDALGAVGVARLFVVAGHLGGQLYHPDDPAGEDRELDDRAFALDHIERKLLKLPALMHTRAAREEGERRAAFAIAFREQLLVEIGAARP